ncbi:DUF6482 family protein [Vibrio vulnificus]|uniref:DUF6482 family protein n=1 Tax=Vibrio vulnificus TaxID=672 RepID=UPI004059AC4B
MQKHQLDLWLHSKHHDHYVPPKMFVIGCSDANEYLLAIEYKYHLEPIKQGEELMHFSSLDLVKEELLKLGVEKAYLRLHNVYEEVGSDRLASYYDIELQLTPH